MISQAPTTLPNYDNNDRNCQPCKIECFDFEACKKWFDDRVTKYDDHVEITKSDGSKSYVLARTQYYYDRLNDLPEFWGFFPRTFLP